MKYYVLKNASNANGWDMFPAGETIKYTINAETLSLPQGVEVGSMVIGYQSAPKDRFYSLFKVMNISNNSLLFEKEFEINGGIGISEVRDEVREHIESDYSGIFEIEKSDFESICDSMFINASTDFVGKPFGGTLKGKRLRTSSKLLPIFISPYLTALRTKPFMLLAGISGTGKSRIVREMAKACWKEGDEEYGKNNPKNFCMVQVKPNWHDSTELMGYVTRISGKPEYIAGDFIKFIVKAWYNEDTPFFLCLDEMNLAPVEQYFAEYLSVIESRKMKLDGMIATDPILKASYHRKDDGTKEPDEWFVKLIDNLLVECPNEKLFAVRKQFLEEGIAIPQNLFVVGTVNMDETTFSFSRKVLDRAMTIEMNEVDLHGGLERGTGNEIGYIGNCIIGDAAEGCDVYEDNRDLCDQVLAYLEQVNAILEGTPFKIAYRTRNEFLMYAVNRQKLAPESQLWQALDEMTSMKILSRIEGDEERTKKVLDGLKTLVEEQITVLIPAAEEGKPAPKSISDTKIEEMQKKLQATGFTSYWA